METLEKETPENTVRKQRQTTGARDSVVHKFRLDRETLRLLKRAAAKLCTDQLYWSQAGIVRRAIRHYSGHVRNLNTSSKLDHERVQLEIARRGR
jgi:hypothetical protein